MKELTKEQLDKAKKAKEAKEKALKKGKIVKK